MELIDSNLMNKQIQSIIQTKVQMQCFLCLGAFDHDQYSPMIMCLNQHSCCAPCMKQLLKNQSNKGISCPHCSLPINKKTVTKNRMLLTVYDIITAYKKYVSELKQQIVCLKRNPPNNNNNSKISLLSKNAKMANSFIETQYTTKQIQSKQSIVFDDYPTYKSMTSIGFNEQKRKQNLLNYAVRQKIGQLQQIARSNTPFQQVTKIRSGYGTIKKIECMQYFTNLRQLLLYNNHIKVIEGLNNNIKLNILSLSYNKIEKVQNIGQLKELKRLSLQCNKIGKSSAQFMSLYEWKNLQSLTISFHQSTKQQNEECLSILFSKSTVQWNSLKTLYIYNSKAFDDTTKTKIKQLVCKRKSSAQIYWS